jgi:hypothetical protein
MVLTTAWFLTSRSFSDIVPLAPNPFQELIVFQWICQIRCLFLCVLYFLPGGYLTIEQSQSVHIQKQDHGRGGRQQRTQSTRPTISDPPNRLQVPAPAMARSLNRFARCVVVLADQAPEIPDAEQNDEDRAVLSGPDRFCGNVLRVILPPREPSTDSKSTKTRPRARWSTTKNSIY